MATKRPRPLVLLIIDGYGFSPDTEGNAIMMAKQPNMDMYLKEYPAVSIKASGIEVGLPWGEVGNSETGHQNIGSGRVLYQPLPRITLAIQDGSFSKNPALMKAVEHVQKNKGAALHTMGMLSNGGVHSHIDHQVALLDLAAREGIGERTFVHAFLDGRDSPPDSAGNFVNQLQEAMKKLKAGRLASMVGRYFAMDRNKNWDRTQKAYDLLVKGEGQQFGDWQEALKAVFLNNDRKSYEVAPPVLMTEGGKLVRTIKDGDAIIIYNYREDRSVQLAAAFTNGKFASFPTEKFKDLLVVTMADFGQEVKAEIAFPKETIDKPLGYVLSKHKIKQLRVAESEKAAHVTYFFNGGVEDPFPGEDRVTIPSANVRDYATVPQMSAEGIADRVVEEIQKDRYGVIILNFANPDMVGHTGNLEATVKAVEFLDTQIGRVVDAALAAGGQVLLTCDHGNAEAKKNQMTHKMSTDHTINPVPLIYITPDNKLAKSRDTDELTVLKLQPVGILSDVATTVLEILSLPKPTEMTAQSLLKSLQ